MPEDSRAQRLRRLRYRSWHRGTREMDLLLGPYADGHLGELDEAGLESYERLLELPDPQLFAWFAGQTAVPPEAESPALRRVMEYCRRRTASSIE
jgi:antitoxin CptB